MNQRLTSKEILDQFIQKSGLSEEQSKNFIDTFQYVFLQAIEQDKIVKISGLGTFQLVWNKPRKSVDVRTQQEIEIAGHYKLNFTPENALKESVNAEFAHLEPKEIEEPQLKKESPLEKLSQQAKELKGIIDGIQRDNRVETENFTSEQTIEEKVQEVVEIVEELKIEEIKIDDIVEESKIEEIKIDEIVEESKIEEIKVDDIVEESKIEEIKIDDIVEESKIEEIKIDDIVEEPKFEEIKEAVEEKSEEASDVLKRVREMFEGKSVEDQKEEIAEMVEEEKIEIVKEEVKEEIAIEEAKIEEFVEEKTEIVEEKTEEQPTEIEHIEDEKELAQKQSAIDFFYQKPEPPIEVKANTFDYLENYEYKPKKQRRWVWWLIILLLTTAALTAFYFLQSDLAKKYWNFTSNKATELTQKVIGWFGKSETEIDDANIDTDNLPADTIKVDLDTITQLVQPVKPVETPEISIFNQPRTYTEFITSVTMSGGNTLVKLSEKYYGDKVFWVYIYEANKNKISNPNNIAAGQVIKVPKLDAKLIDRQNSACLEYAQKLHNQYIKN